MDSCFESEGCFTHPLTSALNKAVSSARLLFLTVLPYCLVLCLRFVFLLSAVLSHRVFCFVLLSKYLYSLCCPRFCHTSKVAEARCREYVKAFPPEIQTLPSLHMPTFNLNLQLKSHTLFFQSIENNANKN